MCELAAAIGGIVRGKQISDAEERYAAFAFGIGVSIVLSSPGLLLVQSVLWLRDGFWAAIEIRQAWEFLGGGMPNLNWRGANSIVQGVLDQPLSLGLLGVGLLWLTIAVAIGSALFQDGHRRL